MTELPLVTIAPAYRGGWLAICDRCQWRLWCISRPPVDNEAVRHRAECGKRRS